MPKRELLHEWMHRFGFGIGYIRIWTNATDVFDKSEYEAQMVILRRIVYGHDGDSDATFKALMEVEFVSAIEELNHSGNGRLVYVDWP